MPGVNITTAVRTGPVGTGDIVSGQVFMVGETERGPLDEPTLLRSFSDFTTYYGNYKSGNLYSHVKTFFEPTAQQAKFRLLTLLVRLR